MDAWVCIKDFGRYLRLPLLNELYVYIRMTETLFSEEDPRVSDEMILYRSERDEYM